MSDEEMSVKRMSRVSVLRSSLIVSSLILFLTACTPTTRPPESSADEITREQNRQDDWIRQAEASGGVPRNWKNRPGMRSQFTRVAERVEEAAADLCREMGLPAKGRSCYYYFTLSGNKEINAFADGENVIVTQGMMRFLNSDNEIALVLGHELAHNMMGHIEAKQMNGLFGLMLGAAVEAAVTDGQSSGATGAGLGAAAGAMAFSPSFEREADYVGMYIAARAGYDVRQVSELWRRMSVYDQAQGSFLSTHPGNAERFVGLEKTAQEIAYKRAKRLPLLPDMKQDITQAY